MFGVAPDVPQYAIQSMMEAAYAAQQERARLNFGNQAGSCPPPVNRQNRAGSDEPPPVPSDGSEDELIPVTRTEKPAEAQQVSQVNNDGGVLE